MFVWISKSGHVYLFLKRRTPGGRVMTGRYDSVFVNKNAPELCLLVVREGRNCVCRTEKRLLRFGRGYCLISRGSVFNKRWHIFLLYCGRVAHPLFFTYSITHICETVKRFYKKRRPSSEFHRWSLIRGDVPYWRIVVF